MFENFTIFEFHLQNGGPSRKPKFFKCFFDVTPQFFFNLSPIFQKKLKTTHPTLNLPLATEIPGKMVKFELLNA